jgi:CelD/BcsL family acetyltransferase involved in cellulose biosynthesis
MNAVVPLACELDLALPSCPAAGVPLGLEVIHELEALAPVWRALQDSGARASAYQHPDWIAAWQAHIGALSGTTPAIVVGRERSGAPLFVLPLAKSRIGGLNVAHFFGGKHSNLNLGVWRPDVAARLGGAEIAAILRGLAAARAGIDLLILLNQPEQWLGEPNPLLHLPHQPSPSFAYRGTLLPDFETLLKQRVGSESRKKLRRKERALERHGPLAFWRAQSAHDARRVLDAFFVQKAERMKQLGIEDAFSEPGVRAFIEAAAVPCENGGPPPVIELYAASVGDTVIATFGGIVSGERFSGMFNSMVTNALANESPGELLLVQLLRMCSQRGLTTFDLGIGEAGYKKTFCPDAEPLFDAVVGLTAKGRLAAPLWRARLAWKRSLKHSPLWARLTARRRRGARRGLAEGGPKPA